MSEELHDLSRIDAYARTRQRVAFMNALWKPALAGAAGAAVIIAAVAVAQPRFVYREIEVPKVSLRDVTVPNIVQHDVPVDRVVPHETIIEIPRIVAPPQSAEGFVNSQPYRDAGIKGRFAGADRNGFKLDSGQGFYPARLVNGKPELVDDALDDVSGLTIGDPVYCSPSAPEGLFECWAWHQGKVEAILVIPVGRRS